MVTVVAKLYAEYDSSSLDKPLFIKLAIAYLY